MKTKSNLRRLTAAVLCLSGIAVALSGMGAFSNLFAQAAPTVCCRWLPGPDMPKAGIRLVGVFFPSNFKFYAMGGRASDSAGSDFTHPFIFNPGQNRWFASGATYPDNEVNNMACGVLNDGANAIFCVGGNAAGATTATSRVFRYDPATDSITTLSSADNWPGNDTGTILPGGFAVTGNKLYILGGFNINVSSTSEIWEFNPLGEVGAKWTQKTNTPVGIMYAPTCAINGIIYVGGASDFSNGLVIDTNHSFSFNPATNTIGSIAPIPRPTGETRALNYQGKMVVLGGGRVAPNPSNEVDIYDPVTNIWTVNSPIPAFHTPRRNFPADTDGTRNIWLAAGYASDNATPLSSMEILVQRQPQDGFSDIPAQPSSN
jgi:N-acetylneuraminic acid mutarotase